MTQMGRIYKDGTGVIQNDQEAYAWYLAAAENGDAEGQAAMATILMNGSNIDTDRTEAYKWMLLASTQSADYASGLKEFEALLTAEEIFEAKKRAKAFVAG
jgi:TPR repeat protein